MRKNGCRGSLTVEASFLFPMVFLTVVLTLFITFYVHNKVWYFCAACEAAQKGTEIYFPGQRETEENVRMRAEQRIREQVMPGTKPQVQISCGKSEVTVTFSGQKYAMFHRLLVPFQTGKTVAAVHPEKYLRIMKAVKSGGVGNDEDGI